MYENDLSPGRIIVSQGFAIMKFLLFSYKPIRKLKILKYDRLHKCSPGGAVIL